jgi:hypothetical protein
MVRRGVCAAACRIQQSMGTKPTAKAAAEAAAVYDTVVDLIRMVIRGD